MRSVDNGTLVFILNYLNYLKQSPFKISARRFTKRLRRCFIGRKMADLRSAQDPLSLYTHEHTLVLALSFLCYLSGAHTHVLKLTWSP